MGRKSNNGVCFPVLTAEARQIKCRSVPPGEAAHFVSAAPSFVISAVPGFVVPAAPVFAAQRKRA
jgi:hypothetical protein